MSLVFKHNVNDFRFPFIFSTFGFVLAYFCLCVINCSVLITYNIAELYLGLVQLSPCRASFTLFWFITTLYMYLVLTFSVFLWLRFPCAVLVQYTLWTRVPFLSVHNINVSCFEPNFDPDSLPYTILRCPVSQYY